MERGERDMTRDDTTPGEIMDEDDMDFGDESTSEEMGEDDMDSPDEDTPGETDEAVIRETLWAFNMDRVIDAVAIYALDRDGKDETYSLLESN
jgi:hypothetical protein